MEHGQVRGILWHHATRAGGQHDGADPNALVPASRLRAALTHLSPADQRRVGSEYARLWARTFRTLVAHLRGRPERALALFAEEVYPFLRGDRLAARVEKTGPRDARLLLADDLPADYLCGLIEGFIALSGARPSVVSSGPGVFGLHFTVAPADRAARLAQAASTLRIPLLLAALLAALLGVAFAASLGPVDALRVVAVLAAVVFAQAGANALHDLRAPAPTGPMSLRPTRAWLRLQATLGFSLASVLGIALSLRTPLLVPFILAGIAASLLFDRARNHGMGPALAVLVYGPLIAEGALHALTGNADHLLHLTWALLTLVPGSLAAALVFVDDLADRPLDEAGGARTLAVRLPRRSQAFAYQALLAVGLAPLVGLALVHIATPFLAAIAAALVVGAVALGRRVARSLDDPHGLAPARLGTLVLHAAATGLLLLIAAGGGA